MTDEDDLFREAFGAHVDDEPPMRTTPEALLRAGRSARRRRQGATMAATALSVATVLGGGYGLLTAGGSDRPAATRSSSGSTLSDLPLPSATPTTPAPMYGGPVSTRIEARVRADLPGGATLVRSSMFAADWHSDVPLPAADIPDATAWHGRFTVAGDSTHEVRAVLSYAPYALPTAAAQRAACGPAAPAVGARPQCEVRDLRDGSYLLLREWPVGAISGGESTITIWSRQVQHVRTNGYQVTVGERVLVNDYDTAKATWVYTADQLAVLARDAKLVLPTPKTWPTRP